MGLFRKATYNCSRIKVFVFDTSRLKKSQICPWEETQRCLIVETMNTAWVLLVRVALSKHIVNFTLKRLRQLFSQNNTIRLLSYHGEHCPWGRTCKPTLKRQTCHPEMGSTLLRQPPEAGKRGLQISVSPEKGEDAFIERNFK